MEDAGEEVESVNVENGPVLVAVVTALSASIVTSGCESTVIDTSTSPSNLIPFYFINQLSFSFLSLLALIVIFSKFILPLFTFQQVIRMYITKLSNNS